MQPLPDCKGVLTGPVSGVQWEGMIPLITFLSDFGTKDAYVAQVKAVICSAVPDARIVDITHDIEPFNLIQAGWLLWTSYRYFPPGTVHLAVVDPGVGTDRAVLVLRKGRHVFVGPDNGLFSFLFPSDEVMEVTWRPEGEVSPTFHARDLFAPLVVKLVTGHGLGVPGRAKSDPVRLGVDEPMVVHVDAFGNVVTNIPGDRLNEGFALEVNGHTVSTAARTFALLSPGELGLVCGSASTIEVAANRARASEIIGARPGMRVVMKGSR